MRHDRRIEERRRFERVFPAEKRANQEPARWRQRPVGKDMYLDPPVNAQQQRVQVAMTGAKFAAHLFEFSPSLLFAQRECATDDLSETRTVRRDERAGSTRANSQAKTATHAAEFESKSCDDGRLSFH